MSVETSRCVSLIRRSLTMTAVARGGVVLDERLDRRPDRVLDERAHPQDVRP